MNSVVCVKWQRLNATGGSTVVVSRRIEWLIRNFCTHICQEPVSVRSKKNFYDSRHCWLLFSCGTFDISESVSPLKADNYRRKKEDQNSFSQMRNIGGGGQETKIITESVSVKKDKQGFSKSMPSGLSQKKEVPQQKVADSLKSLSDRICYFFCLECDHIKQNLANLWGKVLFKWLL